MGWHPISYQLWEMIMGVRRIALNSSYHGSGLVLIETGWNSPLCRGTTQRLCVTEVLFWDWVFSNGPQGDSCRKPIDFKPVLVSNSLGLLGKASLECLKWDPGEFVWVLCRGELHSLSLVIGELRWQSHPCQDGPGYIMPNILVSTLKAPLHYS